MNGERLKRRLPPFIGEISDVEDSIIVIDNELDIISKRREDLIYSANVVLLEKSMEPEKELSRYEKIYQMKKVAGHSFDDRTNAVVEKRQNTETSTTERLERLVQKYLKENEYVKIEEVNEKYYFIVYLQLIEDRDLDKMLFELEEYKPAHLKYFMVFVFKNTIGVRQACVTTIGSIEYAGEDYEDDEGYIEYKNMRIEVRQYSETSIGTMAYAGEDNMLEEE